MILRKMCCGGILWNAIFSNCIQSYVQLKARYIWLQYFGSTHSGHNSEKVKLSLFQKIWNISWWIFYLEPNISVWKRMAACNQSHRDRTKFPETSNDKPSRWSVALKQQFYEHTNKLSDLILQQVIIPWRWYFSKINNNIFATNTWQIIFSIYAFLSTAVLDKFS